MKREQIVHELITSADRNGLIPTLYAVFGRNIKLSIPLGPSTLDADVDDIDFSVRACNCLKRSGMMRMRDVVEAIEDHRLLSVRNLGKTSYNEIQTKLLALAYSKLTHTEKKQFFSDLLIRNGYAN